MTLRVNAQTPASVPNQDGLSWSTAYENPQGAFADARARLLTAPTTDDVSEIWVAVGVYLPTPSTTDRTASFELVDKAFTYGGFDGTENSLNARAGLYNQTILSGDIDGDPRDQLLDSLHVVRIEGDGDYRLDGFQVMLGAAVPGGTPTTTTDEDDWGGGLLVNGDLVAEPDMDVFVTNCRFQACLAGVGGAVMAHYVDLSMSRCTVTGCTAFYPIFSDENSLIPNGGGGAVVLRQCIRAYLYHNQFLGNRATYGGALAIVNGNDDRVVNCLVANNIATGGGGIFLYNNTSTGQRLRVDFTTVANNQVVPPNVSQPTVLLGGGGVHMYGSAEMDLRSSIVWGNTDSNLTDGLSSVAGSAATSTQVALINSDTYFDTGAPPAWTSGSVNSINTDPLFVSPTTGNFMLSTSPASPCIDRADDQVLDFVAAGGLGDVLDVDEDGDTTERLPVDLTLVLQREQDAAGITNPVSDVSVNPAPGDMGAFEAQIDA